MSAYKDGHRQELSEQLNYAVSQWIGILNVMRYITDWKARLIFIVKSIIASLFFFSHG
jgi:hypothetical protein